MYNMAPLTGKVTVTSSSASDITLEIMNSAFPGATDVSKIKFNEWNTTQSSAAASFNGIIKIILDNQEVVYDVEGTTKIVTSESEVETTIDLTATDQESGRVRRSTLTGTAKSLGDKPKRAKIQVKENSVQVSSFEIEQNTESKWGLLQTSSPESDKEVYSYSKNSLGQSLVSAEFPQETTQQEVLDSFAAFATTASGGSLPLFNNGEFQQQSVQFATSFSSSTALKMMRK